MKRVLIVDDSETNRFLLSTQLKDHGFAVMEARHGAEALVKARQSPPDLAISDLLMPVMDGYTLLRHWKADPGLKTVPFIVYTATYTDPKDEQLARELRADGAGALHDPRRAGAGGGLRGKADAAGPSGRGREGRAEGIQRDAGSQAGGKNPATGGDKAGTEANN
jgi:CheY-like chemotaxis protein